MSDLKFLVVEINPATIQIRIDEYALSFGKFVILKDEQIAGTVRVASRYYGSSFFRVAPDRDYCSPDVKALFHEFPEGSGKYLMSIEFSILDGRPVNMEDYPDIRIVPLLDMEIFIRETLF